MERDEERLEKTKFFEERGRFHDNLMWMVISIFLSGILIFESQKQTYEPLIKLIEILLILILWIIITQFRIIRLANFKVVKKVAPWDVKEYLGPNYTENVHKICGIGVGDLLFIIMLLIGVLILINNIPNPQDPVCVVLSRDLFVAGVICFVLLFVLIFVWLYVFTKAYEKQQTELKISKPKSEIKPDE